jgi:hypothetical protein|tara:strand:+ start:1558 stop:1854 length:297 start_codon:yes stop_codon:yes gene_type:complete
MSCKHCSAIGGVESFLDDTSNWYGADEWSKMVQELKEEDIRDICIQCGKETSFKKIDEPKRRLYGYIEGKGQLCFTCHQTRKMHKTGNYGNSEWTRYG